MINYEKCENDIIVRDIKDFDLCQTLECGQAFHFEKIAYEEYVIIAKGRLLHVKQIENDGKLDVCFFDTTMEEFERVWIDYFDFNTDYAAIKKKLLENDSRLEAAIKAKWGVHLLNQDFFETLMSFIISQNKQIPQIKQLVFKISEYYGEYAGEYNGKVYNSFPDVDRAADITVEMFKDIKTGFRAPYLYGAAQKCKNELIDIELLRSLEDEMLYKELTSIKGVGDKVANCVMLFSLGRRAAFPVDVWMKRIMEKLYFNEDTKKEIIVEFAKEHFGELGGYAQQYLFYYARDLG